MISFASYLCIALSAAPFILSAVNDSVPFQGIGMRGVSHFLNAMEDSFLYHPKHVLSDDRPAMESGYTPRSYFKLDKVSAQVNWNHCMPCVYSQNQWSAHFRLDVVAMAPETREVGMAIYLAGEQAKKDGTYDIRIEVCQKPPEAWVTVYNSAGVQLQGPVPLRPRDNTDLKKPYLPWAEGIKQFYSVVCEKRDEKVYLLLIQHTKEEIHEYEQTSLLVREMIDTYCAHERLRNRPGAYLEIPIHMRCLPVPYFNAAYKPLFENSLYVSWATISGELEVMPA